MSTEAVFPAVVIAALLALGVYFDSAASISLFGATQATAVPPAAIPAGIPVAKNANGAQAPK